MSIQFRALGPSIGADGRGHRRARTRPRRAGKTHSQWSYDIIKDINFRDPLPRA